MGKKREKIKAELTKICKGFNRSLIYKKLNEGYELDERFHLLVSVEIKYIARKHGLPHLTDNIWKQIYTDLVDDNIDGSIRLRLAQAMKYSIRNGCLIMELEILTNALKTKASAVVKSELIWALAYQMKNFHRENPDKEIDKNLLDQIKDITEGKDSEVSNESLSFLYEQVKDLHSVNDNTYRRKLQVQQKLFANHSRKRIRAAVTKTQQKSKIKYKNSQFEASTDRLSFVTILKSRKRSIQVNSTEEILPNVPEAEGNDRSILRGTYSEVSCFYKRMKNGMIIKSEDRDKYLPDKFLGMEKKWLWDTVDHIQALAIDRMIVDIFYDISKKKCLNDEIIGLLMNCVDDVEQLEKQVFGDSDWRKSIENEYMKIKDDDFLRDYLQIGSSSAASISEQEVIRIIYRELKKLRLVAISIIDISTKSNSKILTEERLDRIKALVNEKDLDVKKIVLNILKSKAERTEDHRAIFNEYSELLRQDQDVETPLNYIYDQSKDEKKCQILFNDEIIINISNILKKDNLNEKIVVTACATINNYLRLSSSHGLCERQLKNYVHLLNNPQYSEDAKIEALKSVVLTLEENGTLPEFMIETLTKIINRGNNKVDNYYILICESLSKDKTIKDIDQLSVKLLEDWVLVRDENDITFEHSSQENQGSPFMSSIVAEIFANSLQQDTKISDRSIENLVEALGSNDKQTCILSAKALYLASKSHTFKTSILLRLQEYVSSCIFDVSVYSTAAYAQGLKKLSSAEQLITKNLIDFLSNVYAFEELQLEEESFTDFINSDILSVLFHEAANHQFEEDIFQIFNHIFLMENNYVSKAIEILLRYSSNTYRIPASTILSLENIVGTPDLSDKVLQLLENVVCHNGVISEKLLHTVADNFYSLDNDVRRKQSFIILDKASENQDISDELFDILELERTSHTIGDPLDDANDSITYLYERTREGKKVTISVFQALCRINLNLSSTRNEKIFSILLNVSENQQIIPTDLIDKLVNMFDPKLEQSELINIFENLVQNNQKMSDDFSIKLAIALENPKISDQAMFIFLLQGQKGKNLPEEIVCKILKRFLSLENPLTMSQYLSFICSIIEKEVQLKTRTKNSFHDIDNNRFNTIMFPLVRKALVYALKKDDQEIIRKSTNGLNKLSSIHQIDLDKETIDLLLRIASDLVSDESTKEDIGELLKHSSLDHSQKAQYDLVFLVCSSDSEFLYKLNKFTQPALLQRYFDRMNSILNNKEELRFQVIDILMNCSNKKNIPDKVLDTIAILLRSSKTEEIKSLYCKLIYEIDKQGKLVTDEIISLIVDQGEEIISTDALRSIVSNKSIPQALKDKIQLSLTIRSKPHVDPQILHELLNSIRKEFQENKVISNSSINRLLACNISEQQIQDKRELAEIYALILIDTFDNRLQPFIDSLEKFILSKIITKNILNAYQEIIKRTRCKTNNFLSLVKVFNDVLDQNKEFELEILVCIALAFEFTQISDFKNLENGLSNDNLNLKHLEKGLSDDNDVIRSWAFRGLRAAFNKHSYSSVFEEYCNNKINELRERTQSEIPIDFDLLETISSSKFDNFDRIRYKPKDQWSREIIMFDLVRRFQMNEEERSKLDHVWLCIEQEKAYANGNSAIILQMMHRFLLNNPIPLDQIYQTIEILKDITFENARNILLNSRNLVEDLKRKLLTEMIYQRLVGINDISKEYIEDLLSEMMSTFGFHLSRKILHAVGSIESLQELKSLLKFAETNNIKSSDIYVEKKTILVFRRSLEIIFLGKYIEHVDRLQLGTLLDNLLDQNWSFKQLTELVEFFKKSNYQNRLKDFLKVLEVLSNYKIPSTYKEQISFIMTNPPENWLTQVNKIAIENIFSDRVQEKNSQELIDEFIALNSHNEHLNDLTKETLLNWIDKVKNPPLTSLFKDEEGTDGYALFGNPIHEWCNGEILKWVNLVKKDIDCTHRKDFVLEALAVIKQGTLLDTGFHLTDTQILSCLIALNPIDEKGRLLQVATGEGKSTIISILAVVYALKGRTVDIITSSPVLAERDAKLKTKFYKMFGLVCSHNSDKAVYLSGPKACYKADIVYGEVAQFQFDALRTEYSRLNTLGVRKHDVAIVDEVDSMLIDDSSKIARLSTSVPGMDQLQILYHLLWNYLLSLQDKIIQLDNKIYLFYGKVKLEQDQIILEYADDEENIILINDLKSYVVSGEDISHIGFRITENDETDKLIKKILDKYIRSYIKEHTELPRSFKNFIDTQIPKWIDNALTALIYQENIHYIIHEGVIKPVDYYSTGIVQSSSNWSDGLHQFLQLKHNLKMTSETFTTNFLSNVGYFKKYKSSLFGFTGTLGSKKAREVLEKVYTVDLGLIPSLCHKQHLSLPDIILANETDWLKEICECAIWESKKERGTLIICQTIEHCKIIEEELRRKYRPSAIKLYTMNDMNQEQMVEVIYSGEIIVATNLAGRGTDIKTNEIEKYGGLHVIVSFMPENQRVEEQAFGRTSRQGKRGTSQKILNAIHLIHYECLNMSKITEVRDRKEANLLDEFEENEIKVINLKDELFEKFCLLLNEIRRKISENAAFLTVVTDTAKSLFKHVSASIIESNTLLSIEERWAMFLREVDGEQLPIDSQQIHAKFDNFRQNVLDDFNNKCVIKNPYYHIIIGNDLIINDSSLNNNYDEAMKHFDRAIELDEDHCAAAFVGKGWILLKGKEKILLSNKQEESYKDAAIIQFRRALDILSEEMGRFAVIQTFLSKRYLDTNTPLYKQLLQKSIILATYCDHIHNLINTIRKSQRLIQIREIISHSNQKNIEVDISMSEETISYEDIDKANGDFCNIRLIFPDNPNCFEIADDNCKEIIIQKHLAGFSVIFSEKNEGKLNTYKVNDSNLKKSLSFLSYDGTILDKDKHPQIYNQIYQKLISRDGCIREGILAPFSNALKKKKYEITFNDLTVRKDTKTFDQATEVIDKAAKELRKISNLGLSIREKLVRTAYKHISLSLPNINFDALEQLFNPNIEIKHVTKEVALAHLKDKRSFSRRHLLPEDFRPDSYRVNLDIICDGEVVILEKDLQVRKAIQSIKNQRENNVVFNITFLSANDIYKTIVDKVIDHSEITAKFVEQNGQEVAKKVAQIKSESINLEISAGKGKILEIIRSLDMCMIEVHFSRRRQQKYENKREAEKMVQQSSENIVHIGLIGVTSMEVDSILRISQDAIFNISFSKIEIQNLLNEVDNQSVNIYFNELDQNTSKLLITQVRKIKVNFSLIFKNLNENEARKLIDIVPLHTENIEIRKVKRLEETFMSDLRPDLELSEFSGQGIEYLLEISEKNFIPWISVSIVAGIAATQMAVGAVLVTTGLGATLGMGLITEGGADLIISYRAYSTRDFDWSDYGRQKAISVTISVASMGISAIKDAGKGAKTLVTAIGDETVEQIGTNLVKRNVEARQILVKTGENLKSLVKKQIGVTVGNVVLRESLSKLANVGSNFVLEQIKRNISDSIQNRIIDEFCKPDRMTIIRKMYALDRKSNNKKFEKKINEIITSMISCERSFCRGLMNTIGTRLSERIFQNMSGLQRLGSSALITFNLLNEVRELTTIVETIFDQLLEKLKEINRETLSLQQIFCSYCSVSGEVSQETVTFLERQQIIEPNKELANQNCLDKLNLDNIRGMSDEQHKIVNFLKSLCTTMHELEMHDFSKMMRLLSDITTDEILKVTEAQLIVPLSTAFTNLVTNAVSERVQHYLIVDVKQNAPSQTQENEETGYTTIAKQIQANVRDYVLAYSQCKNIDYVQEKGQITKNHEIYIPATVPVTEMVSASITLPIVESLRSPVLSIFTQALKRFSLYMLRSLLMRFSRSFFTLLVCICGLVLWYFRSVIFTILLAFLAYIFIGRIRSN